jgi:hypothetical protein
MPRSPDHEAHQAPRCAAETEIQGFMERFCDADSRPTTRRSSP